MAAKRYSDYAEELAQQVIEMVEANQAPWQRSYDAGQLLEPVSFSTEKAYQGQNALRLALTGFARGYEDNRWITEKAANALGGSVKQDEGVPVLFFTDEATRNVVNPTTGEKETRTVKLARPVLVVTMAYNVHEVNGLQAKVPEAPETLGWESAAVLEHLRDVTQARIVHNDSPAYSPANDTISMPPPSSYKDEGAYNKTLLHEISHWTGNGKRLNRDLSNPFGSSAYAREELVAEISAMLTCQQTGLAFDPNNGESYVKNWWGAAKELLQDNPTEIMKIAKDAYAAREFIVEGKELDRLKQESVEHKVELSDDEKLSGRIALDIAYREKDEAKAIARAIGIELEWDKANKGWFAKVEEGQNIGNLAKFRTTDDLDNVSRKEAEKAEPSKASEIEAIMDIPYPIKDFAKDEAKKLGVALRFDRQNKNWKATGEKDALEKLQEFVKAQSKNKERNPVEAIKSEPASDGAVNAADEVKVFLDVPFKDKERAKAIGLVANAPLRFDRDARAWYCHHEGDLPAGLKEFEAKGFSAKPEVQSLADKLWEMGATGETPEPIFDGKFHRLAVVGDKAGEKSLSYKAHNNGVANAVIVNHMTGEKAKWLGSAPKLTIEERKEIALSNANAAEKSRRAAAGAIKAAANEAKKLLANSPGARADHPYLRRKGIQPHHLKQDGKGNLLVPMGNAAGETRGYQKISPEGKKRYATGAEKVGNFTSFGKLQNGKPIIIAEGVATGATLSETSGIATVAALDCHNLKYVALELRKVYPDAPIIVAADNDHSKDRNIGLEKAEKAAEAVGGRVLVPRFDKVSEADLSDFNDLARARGKEAVVREVSAAVRTRPGAKAASKAERVKEGKANER
jgi:antirestriction protein ArdC/phage/plasmid primase-like uncharacterized protein